MNIDDTMQATSLSGLTNSNVGNYSTSFVEDPLINLLVIPVLIILVLVILVLVILILVLVILVLAILVILVKANNKVDVLKL